MTDCAERYKTASIVVDLEKNICAGGSADNDTCIGGPGAPLMFADPIAPTKNYRLAGIVSTGPKFCDSKNYPAVYTRVDAYTDWIVEQLVKQHTKRRLQT